MTGDMRDRLIELLNDKLKLHICDACGSSAWKSDTRRVLTQAADHLIANGVVLPPCKVGDTAYWAIPEINGPCVCEDRITEVGTRGFWVSMFQGMGNMDDFTPWEEVGKTVFLTQEEAEKALEEASEL